VLVATLVALATAAATQAGTAQTWRTIGRASDVSRFGTFAYLTRDVKGAQGLRVRISASRGRVQLDGSVFCWNSDYSQSANESFGYRLRSRGYRRTITRSLPVPVKGADATCTVGVSADGQRGRLKFVLQSMPA
jgi:hypothetical protein